MTEIVISERSDKETADAMYHDNFNSATEKGKRSYNIYKKYSKLIFYVVLVKILNAELYKTFLTVL